MDNGLVLFMIILMIMNILVLILVVVDNGLVPMLLITMVLVMLSLNPCCSGQWSRTEQYEANGQQIIAS